MSKYDFGYMLQEGTTNKWAYEQIAEESNVLELGPSIGCLTYNLSKYKKCRVDIIEIDEEAGVRASEFANKALVGNELGNLNNDTWFSQLGNNQYDYVVALDVLEHLEKPDHVLELLKNILGEAGKIILSIPNIAHNAVILELLNNKFTYSNLGLLDRTHIHFFAYDSIIKMIAEKGLYISTLDAIKKHISETEFENSFENIPAEVAGYLRKRNQGDVYQYLLVLEKEKQECIDFVGDGISSMSRFQAKILVDGLLKNQILYPYEGNHINIEFDCTSYPGAESLRFVPVEQTAIISNLKVIGIDDGGNRKILTFNWTTGIVINEQTVLFRDKANEINFVVPPKIKYIRISCECELVNKNMCEILNSLHSNLDEEIEEFRKIKKMNIYRLIRLLLHSKRKVAKLLWKK